MKKVLILGSGGLRIGQAGEFDYSGSQAIKALKEEGIRTVLINPNIATVQTDPDMADKVYFLPLNIAEAEKVIKKERPDSILLSFGGQTALNLGLELNDKGILKRYDVRPLGTSIETIKITEDRELFKNALTEIGVDTAKSIATYSVKQAKKAAKNIGYPIMMRSGFALGGLGSGKIENEQELVARTSEAFHKIKQVLIEEYLEGWKEIEYEVVRDSDGNTITVCNMENLDPMGIHTGESIVVAPSQTLTNKEYHGLREVAIKTIQHLNIVGECNIQYALNSKTGEYRVIEVNARLSRSSALASKATGYPLAYVAAKLVLGKKLHELRNSVTGQTSAFFEPALDYVAVKMPRWDLTKLKNSNFRIGSEMKSVGEVMALARSFPEALQKAIRMQNTGSNGLTDHVNKFKNPLEEIKNPTYRRIFAVYEALSKGKTVDKINEASKIDKWFLYQIQQIVKHEKLIKKSKKIDKNVLLKAKVLGFSDKTIAKLTKSSEDEVRQTRLSYGIRPAIKLIDTLAGEFSAKTNYLYLTYSGTENDVLPQKNSIITLGSGPYCIGSSVEFDWCAVNTVKTLKENKKETIIINSNPETVSTDFDISDRLYFDELTFERVSDIADFESGMPIVVSVGGQIANNLSTPLDNAGYKILGTSAKDINNAENRKLFSAMLENLGIDQPQWQEVTTLAKARIFAKEVGYPVLVRPSYVLSGGAMSVVESEADLKRYLDKATDLSPDHPVVISDFITAAKEIEIDGVANGGEVVVYAISEHIEHAGIHSGDATVVLPAQNLYLETIRRIKKITNQVVKSLDITGPFNVQYIAKDNAIKVIECNVRASRSFPFVSKVTKHNFIDIATRAIIGKLERGVKYNNTLDLDYVAVKNPQFSYNRLKGADPVASVEMASTGEVACFGDTLEEAFYNSWLATEQEISGKNICLSVPDEQKYKFIDEAQNLLRTGYELFATPGTHEFLKENGVKAKKLYKIKDKKEPSLETYIAKQKLDLAVVVPREDVEDIDGYTIRRLAVDHHLPLITNAETGRLLLRALTIEDLIKDQPKSWADYS